MKRIFNMALILVFLATGVCAQELPVKAQVYNDMQRVAKWQIENYKPRYGDLDWTTGALFLGMVRWASIAEQSGNDASFYDWLIGLGEKNHWNVKNRRYHADDIAVAQNYLQLYHRFKRPEMIAPTRKRADWVISHNPKDYTMDLNYRDSTTLFRWTWCDALFMAPAVYLQLYNITGQKKYIKFMHQEYMACYDYLYDKEEKFFYRDCNFFPEKKREANGKKIFWGRGNGWVLGGLCEILRDMPEKCKYKPFYKQLFIDMVTRVAELQQPDGFWRASMLDPDSYPSPETSCSGFFTYALAFAVNEGYLPRETYMPVVLKAWKAMVSAIEPGGKLGYVQPIGADPRKVTRDMTEVYGVGAFLLAGSEIYRMAQ